MTSRNGGKNSPASGWRTWSALSTTRRSPRSLSTIRSTTTRRIRYYNHIPISPCIPVADTPPQDGRPVYIEKLGKVDLTALGKITSQDRMIQNLVCEYEKMADPRLPACSRKAGYLLETSCTITDLKGVGIAKATSVYGYLGQISAISQNYYPERLGKLYVINAPWGFSTVFSVVKRFLDPVTVNKIHILGSGYEKELLAQIPAENLPKEFGGSCDCEGGCALSDAGPWQDPQWAKPPKWAKKEGEEAKVEAKEEKKEDATAGAAPVSVADGSFEAKAEGPEAAAPAVGINTHAAA